MAFNKSIAEELRERLPSHIDVNTFHSKGLRVLLSNFRIKPKINENKCFVIGKKILDTKDMDVKQQIRYLFEIQIIWNYIRVNLITDYEKEIPGICIEKNIEFQERMVGDMEQIRNAWHKEMKNIHMEQQKIMIQKDKDYKVHPLYLFVEKEEFNDLIRRIRGKNRNAETACIPLVCQYPAVPICVLCLKQEEEGKE